MSNHVHLIVTPEHGDSLAVLFRRVHGRYAGTGADRDEVFARHSPTTELHFESRPVGRAIRRAGRWNPFTTGSKLVCPVKGPVKGPVSIGSRASQRMGYLSPPGELPVFRRYLHLFAFFDEERHFEFKARLQPADFVAAAAGRVTLHAWFGVGDVELDKHR